MCFIVLCKLVILFYIAVILSVVTKIGKGIKNEGFISDTLVMRRLTFPKILYLCSV